jgi:hypothetical protein
MRNIEHIVYFFYCALCFYVFQKRRNYFQEIFLRPLIISLKLFSATFGNSLSFPHSFLKSSFNKIFFALAPPLSILLLLSMAVFQASHINFSDFEILFSALSSRLLNKISLCRSIPTGQISVQAPHRLLALLKCE